MSINSNSANLDIRSLQLGSSFLLALGFGLHNAWICSTMYSTQTLFNVSYSFTSDRGEILSLVYLLSALANGGTALVVAIFDQRFTKVELSRSRKIMVMAAIITCIATLTGTLAPFITSLTLFLECFAGIATGVGSAILMLYWAIAFSRTSPGITVICGATGIFLGFVLNSLIVQNIPSPYGGLLVAVIPLAEFVILNEISPHIEDKNAVTFFPLPSSKASFGLMFVVPVGLVGAALCILKHISVQSTLNNETMAENIVVLLMGGGMTLFLFVLLGLNFDSQKQSMFFTGIVPAIACTSLIVAIIVSSNKALEDLFILVAYILIETLMWITFACISRETRISPLFLFGITRGILTVAMGIGTVLAPYAEPLIFVKETLVIFMVTCVVALGFIMMPRKSDVMRAIARCPLVRLVSLNLDEGANILPTHSTMNTAQDNPVNTIQDNPAAKDEAQRGKESSNATQSATHDDGTAVFGNSVDKAYKSTQQPARSIKDANNKEHSGRFSRKVKLVAQTYLLTKRETDILFELAKGNSPVFIQEKYFISAGTVKTHVRNIYRKLNVHKRQDLMHLIDEFDSFDE